MQNSENTPELIVSGMRDNNAARHWRSLQKGYSLRTGPKKILTMPGNGAQTAKAANGMCKVVQNLLGNTSFKYEVCGFYYPDNDRGAQSTAVRADTLLNEYFVPLIADKNQLGDLVRLSKDEACKNMRNVVVMTHCYGSRMMAVIDEKLEEIMADIGYSKAEIADIHRQLVVVHHNNPRDELGQKELGSSNLYRITQADEANKPGKYMLESFPYYVATEDLQADEVLLAAIYDNEHALLIPRVCNGEESEHNGAYWMASEKKTPAGQIEEKIFRAIFKEAVTSGYYIESLDRLEERAISKEPQLQSVFTKIKEYGAEFMEDYQYYKSDAVEDFFAAKDKLLKQSLSADEIAELAPEALFMTDENMKNLLDYAVEKKDISTVKNLWSKMREELPQAEAGNPISSQYEVESADMLNAKIRQRVYLQRALEKDDLSLFSALVETEDLSYLDYKNAGEKLMRRIGGIYCKLEPETAKTDLMQFRKCLNAMTERMQELPVDAETSGIKKALKGKISASDQRYISMLDMMRPSKQY